jgi:hypothetical protein
LKSDATTPAQRLKTLQIEIEGYDSLLLTSSGEDCGANKLVGLVNLYYGIGLNSVEVGDELGLKPPCVRGTLWRMARVWERMKTEGPAAPPPPTKSCIVCGKEVPKSNRKFCGRQCLRNRGRYRVLRSESGDAVFAMEAVPAAHPAEADYQNYVDFCKSADAAPLPFSEWNAGRRTAA